MYICHKKGAPGKAEIMRKTNGHNPERRFGSKGEKKIEASSSKGREHSVAQAWSI